MIAGQAGLMSLRHGAFYGLGAYTVAVVMRHWSVSAYAAILAAGLVGLITGYGFGRLVTRLAGFYLALATFALPWRCHRSSRAAIRHLLALDPLSGGLGVRPP
jgi:branched-chain amino acid transport system permease protein